MNHPLHRAALGLAFTLALSAIPFGPSNLAVAADEDERRAVKLGDLDQQETVSEEYQRLAEEKRFESISRLKALLRDSPEGDRKAEMMLRLADLYFEQGPGLYIQIDAGSNVIGTKLKELGAGGTSNR